MKLLILILLLASMMVLALRTTAQGAEAICSDPAVIFCDDFEQGNLSMWQDGFNPALHSLTTTAANVYQGQRALQVTYPAGSEGGWLTRWFMPGHDLMYARLYWKFETGWQSASKIMVLYGNQLNNQWSGFGKAGVCPNGTDYYYAGVVTSTTMPSPGEYIFYSYFPGMTGGCFGLNTPMNPPLGLQANQWYCIQLEVGANTPGQSNGYQRTWVDGALKGVMLNMRWRDTTNLKTNAIQLSFSSPGGVPSTTHVFVDNVVVSTNQIGCLSADTIPPLPPTGLRVE